MFSRVLVANRGEIARRVIRTLRSMGITSVAVYSEADASLPFVQEADEAYLIGPASPSQSYLDTTKLLAFVADQRIDAVHPGYGFLSENFRFAQAVSDAGATWIGPAPATIEAMGDKINSKNLMAAAQVPVARGSHNPVSGFDDALALCREIGFPVMVKPSAGGGGIGMSVVRDEDQLRSVMTSAEARAERLFGSASILIEEFLPDARHIEVQILGTAQGEVLALGERDCSIQRRHQKLLEESPAPNLPAEVHSGLVEAAVRAGEAVDYRGVGTVEFLVSGDKFMFLEMNTRLQVEHPVTELVTGLDLVEAQILVAAGERLTVQVPEPSGHAIEVRVCAEDPVTFLPRPGSIERWEEPQGEGIRVDSGYASCTTVSPHYDPLLAKLCAWGETREQARARLVAAVDEFVVEGLTTNLPLFADLLRSEVFISGAHHTATLGSLAKARA